MDSKQSMRKRGWSIHSEASVQTAQSEELTGEQKKMLLENFPRSQDDQSEFSDDGRDMFAQDSNDDDDGGDKVEILETLPPRKKVKTTKASTTTTTTTVSAELLNHAKTKLSKWAARLFDPDRPRGLVQAPAVIPLNDEFLTAFGKREKAFDEKLGRTTELVPMEDEKELQEDEQDIDASDEDDLGKKSHDAKPEFGAVEGRKLKITNLSYSTTEERLAKVCSFYGPLVQAKIIMDKENRDRSSGRAYITFEQAADAKACMDNMKPLDGRPVRITMAEGLPARGKSSNSSHAPSRYWERDISTKCFRCGQVGHMEPKCPNEALAKPCPLCGNTDHEMWSCSNGRVCFKCGLPGHVSRDCRERMSAMPKRMMCGICFGSGHHRVACRYGPYDVPNTAQAKCMVCQSSGHFMCQEMKWFFGLEGVSCFNCGRKGHLGYDCDRPPVDICGRDESVGKSEVEQAQALQLADDLQQQQRNRGRDRGRWDDRGRGDDRGRMDERNIYRPRPKSQPPQSRGYSTSSSGHYSDSRQGSFQRRNDNRGYGGRR